MERFQKTKNPLIEADGNIFNLMGIASRFLKEVGREDLAKEMQERVQMSDSYFAALGIIDEYVEYDHVGGISEEECYEEEEEGMDMDF